MQRAAILQRHANHGALGGFRRLADRFGDFARLAMAEADASALIADYNKRRKSKPAAAFHHFGNAVDMHKLVDEFAFAFATTAFAFPRFTFACHGSSSP
jgi:hypothetical protein